MVAGGLIQIATYGSQDLYLTGTPEITFFKIVYRRYTNFAMESVKINFDDTVGFGRLSSLTVPKVGDLIHKTYLEIVLPEIDLKRFNLPDPKECQTLLKKYEENYQILLDFMNINRKAYVEANDIVQAENTNDSKKIIDVINQIFNEKKNIKIINERISIYKDSSDNETYSKTIDKQAVHNLDI